KILVKGPVGTDGFGGIEKLVEITKVIEMKNLFNNMHKNLNTIGVSKPNVIKKRKTRRNRLKSKYVPDIPLVNGKNLRNLDSNSLILSKVWYAAYILTPNRKQLSELNDMISNWIKN
ncbi:7338_t:CDS:2, partial [Gigaspora rosea]